MGQHGAGRHEVCSGEVLYTSHPQDKSSESEDNKNSESEEESTEEESDEEDRDGDVDPGFREQLMAVLQAGKALVSHSWRGPSLSVCTCPRGQAAHGIFPQGGVDDDDEELGDEAMMALDQNLSSLFAEQKLRIQARRDEKNKLQKEKALRRDFQIRVSLRPSLCSPTLQPSHPARPLPLYALPHLTEPTRPGHRSWT